MVTHKPKEHPGNKDKKPAWMKCKKTKMRKFLPFPVNNSTLESSWHKSTNTAGSKRARNDKLLTKRSLNANHTGSEQIGAYPAR